jgi:5-methylcytosine-specific restriction endonuclease McrA
MIAVKTCSLCGRTLPLTEFVKHRRSADGHYSRCRACHRRVAQSQRSPAPRRRSRISSTSKKSPPVARSSGESGKKRCAACDQVLPLADFGKRSVSVDGLHYWCRTCSAAKAKQRRQELQATDQEQWRTQHREQARKWRENRREVWLPKHREQQERRHERLNQNGGTLTDADWQLILKRYGYRCLACGSTTNLTLDHIVPLAHGGRHDADNVQPLCRACNASKRDHTIDYRLERTSMDDTREMRPAPPMRRDTSSAVDLPPASKTSPVRVRRPWWKFWDD